MKRKSTKMRIVDCALRLFSDKGYPNVTVEDICQEAGVTRSAFYYHFSERDAVFDEFFLIPNTYVIEHLPDILEQGSYVDQFYAIYDIYYDRSLKYGPEVLGQMYTRSINKHMEFLTPSTIDAWDVYISLVEKGQRAGQIRNPAPAEQLVENAVYIGGGLTAVWLSGGAVGDVVERTHRAFDVLFMVE